MIKQVKMGTNLEVESFLEKIPGNTLLRFYHGTSPLAALKIIGEQKLLPDDLCKVGLASNYETARSYSRYKAGKDGVVLMIAVKRSELGISERIRYSPQHMPRNTRYFGPETGGTGRNSILVGEFPLNRKWSLKLHSAKITRR